MKPPISRLTYGNGQVGSDRASNAHLSPSPHAMSRSSRKHSAGVMSALSPALEVQLGGHGYRFGVEELSHSESGKRQCTAHVLCVVLCLYDFKERHVDQCVVKKSVCSRSLGNSSMAVSTSLAAPTPIASGRDNHVSQISCGEITFVSRTVYWGR